MRQLALIRHRRRRRRPFGYVNGGAPGGTIWNERNPGKKESVRFVPTKWNRVFFASFSGVWVLDWGSGLKFSLIFLDCDCGFGGDEQCKGFLSFQRCQLMWCVQSWRFFQTSLWCVKKYLHEKIKTIYRTKHSMRKKQSVFSSPLCHDILHIGMSDLRFIFVYFMLSIQIFSTVQEKTNLNSVSFRRKKSWTEKIDCMRVTFLIGKMSFEVRII